MTTKLQILLTPDGHKRAAKQESPYSWDFTLSLADGNGEFYPAKDGYTLLLECEVTLPDPAIAIHVALDRLKEQEANARDELNSELAKIEEERGKLLSLTYNMPADVVESFNV